MIRLKNLLKEQTSVPEWLDNCTGSTSTNRKWSRDNVTGLVTVNGSFNCSGQRLRNLRVRFDKVTGDFDCSNNYLTSLQGAPQEVGGSFICRNNSKQFTEDDVRAVTKVSGQILV